MCWLELPPTRLLTGSRGEHRAEAVRAADATHPLEFWHSLGGVRFRATN
jgi:hypothetical protein